MAKARRIDEASRRNAEALFRLAVLGDMVHTEPRRGRLRRSLEERSRRQWQEPRGRLRSIAAKTIEGWYYAYRARGFEGLVPKARRDRGTSKAIPAELQHLIVEMKREDPGRSVPMIVGEIEDAGLARKGDLRPRTVARLLRREGLSGPQLELKTAVRLRFVAATCGELWQGDACHGPKLFDPASGREIRAKIFGLIDDKSRLVPFLRASFHETQEEFLRLLHAAVLRRGVPRKIFLDNHGSFTGEDTRLACAKLGARLVFARPYDGAAKGKIERFWRTLRHQVLDRLDLEQVRTLDDLNLRLMAWVDGHYQQRPHAGLSGRTPLSVWEEDASEIRWIEDHAAVESAFLTSVERRIRNDSTCTVRGRTFEVPSHLRGGTIEVHFHLFAPTRLWIVDGTTEVPLEEVDPTANSRRSRGPTASRDAGSDSEPRPAKSGLHVVEDQVQRLLRPADRREEEGGSHA